MKHIAEDPPCSCSHRFSIEYLSEGRYRLGDKILFIRVSRFLELQFIFILGKEMLLSEIPHFYGVVLELKNYLGWDNFSFNPLFSIVVITPFFRSFIHKH